MIRASLRYLGGLAAASSLSAFAIAGVADVAAAQTVTIKMWTLNTEDYPLFVEEAATEYKKTHPNVEIVYEGFPNEAYKTALQVGLVGSEPPDVFFNWAGDDAGRLVRDGLAADITEYGDKPGGYGEYLSDGWQASFAYDGKIYGVPMQAVSKYFYYNNAFFKEHNLSPPADFGGMLQLCRDIRAIDPEIVPWPLGNSERWKLNHVITMLNQRMLGAEATAADYALTAPDDELFADPGYVEAWQRVLDLKEAGCFQDAPNATAPEATRSMFSSEVSPMIYCGTWCAQIFYNEGFTDFSMFRFPSIEGGNGDPDADFFVPEGLQVSTKSAHIPEAVEWASFLVSPERAKRFAEIRGAIPSNPALVDSVEGSPQWKWIVKDMSTFSSGVMVLDVLLNQSVSEAYLNMGVEVLNGTKTPQQAMDEIRATALAAKAK